MVHNEDKVMPIDSVEGADELVSYYISTHVLKPNSSDQSSRMFVSWLKNQMTTRQWTTADLAREMDCPIELVRNILSGQVPTSQFDSGLVEMIAIATQYDESTLWMLLGREEVVPIDVELQNKSDEIRSNFDALVDEFINLTTQKHYTQSNRGLRQRYKDVLEKLEAIVAQQRRDLDLVERLKAHLQDPEPSLDDIIAQQYEQTEYTVEDIRRIVDTIDTIWKSG